MREQTIAGNEARWLAGVSGRINDRIRALWGCEGSVVKNALDANTECSLLLNKLKVSMATTKAIGMRMQEWRDNYAPEPLPDYIDELVSELELILSKHNTKRMSK